jgi:hypothetical protein
MPIVCRLPPAVGWEVTFQLNQPEAPNSVFLPLAPAPTWKAGPVWVRSMKAPA